MIAAQRLPVWVDTTAFCFPSCAHACCVVKRRMAGLSRCPSSLRSTATACLLKPLWHKRPPTVRRQGGNRNFVVTELRLMVVVTPGSMKKAELFVKLLALGAPPRVTPRCLAYMK
ncbi:hypothetical protein BN1723_008790 [Verticillium longisporum]|uniref:Uncharacterized protein n=1 Tax=Verticillium longisporum TaxID=100787 RepID=A0A0G4KIR6_VERLO|nr:hypothetical protein BN1723_008790 [Verticillium longisporum]